MGREAVVGFMFSVAVVLFAVFVLYASDWTGLGQTMHTLDTTFDNVAGLEPEDPVSLAGVVVGDVRALTVDGTRVRVTMRVRADAAIRTDSIAKLESESLLGGRRIDISLGTADAPLASAGSTLPSARSADIDQLMDSVSAMTTDVRGLVQRFNENQDDLFVKLGATVDEAKITFSTVNRILGENEEGLNETLASLAAVGPRLESTISQLDEITAQIQSGEGTIGKLVYDSALHDDVLELVASMRASSDKLGNFLDGGDGEDGGLGGTFGVLADSGPALRNTIERLDRITAKLEAGEGTLGQLLTNDELYVEATRAVKAVGDAAENAREQGPISTFTGALIGAATAFN